MHYIFAVASYKEYEIKFRIQLKKINNLPLQYHNLSIYFYFLSPWIPSLSPPSLRNDWIDVRYVD